MYDMPETGMHGAQLQRDYRESDWVKPPSYGDRSSTPRENEQENANELRDARSSQIHQTVPVTNAPERT